MWRMYRRAMIYARAYALEKADGSLLRNAHTGELVVVLEEESARQMAGNGNSVVPVRLGLALGHTDAAVDIRPAVAAALMDGDQLGIRELCEESAETARSKGFSGQSFPEFVALCHTELSESFEEWRGGKEISHVYYSQAKDSDARKPEGVLSELADVIIRIAHHVGEHGLTGEFVSVLRQKLAFNRTRAHKHGGKRI